MTGSERYEVNELLQHAEWHCRFGSEPTERTPDDGDVAAAEILKNLRQMAKREGQQ